MMHESLFYIVLLFLVAVYCYKYYASMLTEKRKEKYVSSLPIKTEKMHMPCCMNIVHLKLNVH